MAKPDDDYEDDAPPQGRERLAGGARRPARKKREASGDGAGRGGTGFFSSFLTGQSGTRGLMILAVVGAGLLLVIGGVWNWVVGNHPAGVPVIGPPPYAVKDRPADPGGMMIMGDDTTKSDVTGRGAVHLAPPPEQPDAGLLAGRLDPSSSSEGEKDASPKPVEAKEGAAAKSEEGTGTIAASSHGAESPAVAEDAQKAPAVEAEKRVETPHESAKAPAVKEGEVPPPAKIAPLPPPMPEDAAGQEKTAKPSNASPSATLYEVQLAALQSEAQARQEWAHLRSRLPELLGGREPILRTIDRDGKHFVRLRVGGFADRAEARQFCVKLHAQAQACAVATN